MVGAKDRQIVQIDLLILAKEPVDNLMSERTA
jgi:hypothetical protein